VAKGWESKSIEEQQSEAINAKRSLNPQLPVEQIKAAQIRQGLELSRHRVLQQLQLACNPKHRSMLERALADLDERLAKLEATH
jgi:hypothetical protein